MKIVYFSLILMLVFSAFGDVSWARQFGHIVVFADTDDTGKLSGAKISLETSIQEAGFDSEGKAILWNIHAGKHVLQLVFPDSRKTKNLEIVVYPGLTTKVFLETENGNFEFRDAGFADQAGQVLLFDRASAGAFPGELNDGLGIMAGGIYDSSRYSYDGLEFAENSTGRSFNPTGKTYADYAMINISDPFAGYENADVSLISNFGGPDRKVAEGVYATRDRRFYRVSGGHKLPRQTGSFFGSLNFENLEDAAPRWNIDYRLPHNDAENVETLGGAGLNINSRIKADARFFYKRYKRNYYNHSYYFNIIHAPKEESNVYNGGLSVYGWLTDNFFAQAGFGIEGDDSKLGDGVYFDNLEDYVRPYGNPNFDETGLFWSWDNIDSLTPTVYDYIIDTLVNGIDTTYDTLTDRKYVLVGDEGHVWDDYKRYKTTGKVFFAGVERIIGTLGKLGLNAKYSISNYRHYENLFPVIPNSEAIINIGFDSLGVEETDSNDFADIPEPKRLDISLQAERITKDYFLKASLDYLRFDPGTLALRDSLRPFDADGGTDESLDISDLRDAEAKSKLGYRVAAGASRNKSGSSVGIDIYASYCKRYIIPDYSNLYFDYGYFERHVSAYGFYYQFGNPDLKPEETMQYEFGAGISFSENRVTLSYKHSSFENLAAPAVIPADPKAYVILMSVNFRSYDAITLGYQSKRNSIINASMLGQYIWNVKGSAGSAAGIDWNGSSFSMTYPMSNNAYRLAGLLVFKPAYIVRGYDPHSQVNTSSFLYKAISRTQCDITFDYKSGLHYTPLKDNIDPVRLNNVYYDPAGPLGSSKMKDYFEINTGVTARLLDLGEAFLSLRFEVLNLFNTENHLNVYGTSGSADETGWLTTEPGEAWVEANQTVEDSSNMTGVEKYLIKQNDPGNFYRPRLFRIMARVEF